MFIERTEPAGSERKNPARDSEIIPGDWGKVGRGWFARLLKHAAQAAERRQYSPAPLAEFALRQSRDSGAERPGAIRNRSKSSQVSGRSFDARRIAVTQRVDGCYRAPARAQTYRRPDLNERPQTTLNGVTKRATVPGRPRRARRGNLPQRRRCEKPHRRPVN